ncbi:(Fe-S)-binding protein [Geobacter sp. SVR]|nr:(Fe-S)-binding protein [Geobacter sp. SVR]GCF87289.1 (Fe-S)-binding protein [Geobacter sp. SVR]
MPPVNGLLIDTVAPGTLADEFQLEPGDRLLAVNGHRLRDIIDYSYRIDGEQELLLEVARQDGELWELEIERDPDEPLGLTFTPPEPERCGNNCLFCFVHQLPPGLRRPLYVKDEDYRLSFLNGNYVTLANLSPADLERIVEQRLSPLYISVHATNPELRARLLGKPGIPPILEQLRILAESGIRMHTQVVLCPGLNDQAELERTVDDLARLYPAVQSLAVVPLGLTRHRRHLPQLKPVDSDYARTFIATWGDQAPRLRKRLGAPFLFLADEFYLKAGLPFPTLRSYGDLPQIENGVGLVPLFMRDAGRTLRTARRIGSGRVTVVTGQSAVGFVSEFAAGLGEKSGVEIVAVGVENRLFGPSVTVSGLVCGNDIIHDLQGRELGEAVLVPDVMLKEGEGIFLDDVTLAELQQRLSCPVIVFDSTPQGYYRVLRSIFRATPA